MHLIRRHAEMLAILAALFAAAIVGPPLARAVPWLGGHSLWLDLVNYQGHLHRQLADALKALRDGGSLHAALVLGGLSLSYGVVHAAGPGHGKAVISSYLVADGRTIRSGIAMAFAAALVQAVTAVAIVLVGWYVLGLAGFQLTQIASGAETVSFVLVAALGAGMALAGARRLIGCVRGRAAGPDLRGPARRGGLHPHEHGAGCGHDHVPQPAPPGPNRRWRTAGVVLAVGVRPCTGALIVLVFALVNGLFLAGIASTLVMAIGTALTVSVLATLSVQAKMIMLRLVSASHERLQLVHGCLWLAGGILVTGIGVGFLMTPGQSPPF